MSDNTTLDPGMGGDVIATEQIYDETGTATAKVQLQKIMLGPKGQNGGTLSSDNPMPVEDTRVIALLEEILDELQRGNEILEKGL